MQNGPFIVTGASGQLGRQVVGHLLEAGAAPIIAVTRNPDKLADLKEKGVEVRQGDFNDPASLGAAFAGGKRILIISTDDLEPGKRLAAHGNAIGVAAKAGVAHIVYTSLVKPSEDNPIPFTADHRDSVSRHPACDPRGRGCGLGWAEKNRDHKRDAPGANPRFDPGVGGPLSLGVETGRNAGPDHFCDRAGHLRAARRRGLGDVFREAVLGP